MGGRRRGTKAGEDGGHVNLVGDCPARPLRGGRGPWEDIDAVDCEPVAGDTRGFLLDNAGRGAAVVGGVKKGTGDVRRARRVRVIDKGR